MNIVHFLAESSFAFFMFAIALFLLWLISGTVQ
jgi:hypothetical protein